MSADNRNGTLTFGGNVISDIPGISIFPVNIDSAPEKSYEKKEMPLRNGDLLFDDGRFKNISHIYSFVIQNTTADQTNDSLISLRRMLLEKTGYRRMFDSFHPDEIYEAYIPGGINITLSDDRRMAKGELRFERKPQRFLVSGDEAIDISTGLTISNINMPSKPYIVIYYGGDGTSEESGTIQFTQNGTATYIISVTVPPYEVIQIDCETGEIYDTMKNNIAERVTISTPSDNMLPIIPTGTITITSTLTASLTPRFWRL